MAEGQDINQELDIGDVFSRTFSLYRRDFTKFLIIFLVTELVIGVLSTLAVSAITIPSIPAHATSTQALNALKTVLELITLVAVIGFVLAPIALGSAIKIASDEIEKGQADLVSSIRFAATKLPWLWAVSIITGIVVSLGFVALIVPGIILGIMFCLAIPAVIIESRGVIASFSRSRELVGHRWLKTFAIALLFGIMILIASVIVELISSVFGPARTIVDGVLSSFYIPLAPIMLTVYFYSNRARTSPPQEGQTSGLPGVPIAGAKYCPNCGAPLTSGAIFCPNCGANLSG